MLFLVADLIKQATDFDTAVGSNRRLEAAGQESLMEVASVQRIPTEPKVEAD